MRRRLCQNFVRKYLTYHSNAFSQKCGDEIYFKKCLCWTLLLGFCMLAIFCKINDLVRCWTRCGNMWNNIIWALFSRLRYAPYLLNFIFGNFMCLLVRQDAVSLSVYRGFSCIIYFLKMCQHLRNVVIWFKNTLCWTLCLSSCDLKHDLIIKPMLTQAMYMKTKNLIQD
jgi:hypothetical protein